MNIHPQPIKKAGKCEFVVLPFEEYKMLQSMAEDHEDLLCLREAKAEALANGDKGVPLEQVLREFGFEGEIKPPLASDETPPAR